jgi:DNA repair protein RecN (Recombination protein N)
MARPRGWLEQGLKLIEEISIRDLGVISEAKLQFGRGLNVLTGETGAGKTMVLTALGLLLGERADSASVRAGAQQASVDGRWFLPVDSEVLARVSEAGGLCEDGELLLNRSVSLEGRSRASAGSRAVPAGLLSELAQNLVVVHGQSDQLRLRSAIAQREALDQFAGVALHEVLVEYQAHHLAWRNAVKKIEALQSENQNRAALIIELREASTEIGAADPKPNEDVELSELAARLTHSQDILLALRAAHEAISSEGFDSVDAIAQVGLARKSLESVSSHDAQLASLAESLRQLGYELGEIAADISGQLASLEGDSGMRLETVQARRAELSSLMKRFGPTLQDVLNRKADADQKLVQLDDPAEGMDAIVAIERLEHERVQALAEKLTTLRKTAAAELADQVSVELAGLAMPGATLVVKVSETELSNTGRDAVSIMLSAYPGAEPRPISKGASGGELSRIMLALEVCLAKSEQAPTFIFDEVDAGVGGAAAIEVGKRLARLAKNAQVIVVTHLAQVAAFADIHLRVNKSVTDEYTASSVQSLSVPERTEELARMLSGLAQSETAQAHARELLALAAETNA